MSKRSKETGLSPTDQAIMRGLLDADREQTTSRVGSLARDWDEMVESTAMVATDDEHDPEGSSTAFERAHVRAMLDQARGHLADLDRAVRKMGDGTYGRCEVCGNLIAIERLKVRPAAGKCVACASTPR